MKTEKSNSYSSPSIELLALACEQAVMAGSTRTCSDVDNEEFTEGGTFSDWAVN